MRKNKAWPGPVPASALLAVPPWPHMLGEGCQARHTLKLLAALASTNRQPPCDAEQALSLAPGSLWAALELWAVWKGQEIGWYGDSVCQTRPQQPPPWCPLVALVQYKWASKSSFEILAHKTAWDSAAF